MDLSLYTDLRPAPGAPFPAPLRGGHRRYSAWPTGWGSTRSGPPSSTAWTTATCPRSSRRSPRSRGRPNASAWAPASSCCRSAHPRHVIEEACVVDVLSGGRLTLGVAAGNYPNEFRAFGVARERRGRILEEGIRFLKPGLDGGTLPDGLPVNPAGAAPHTARRRRAGRARRGSGGAPGGRPLRLRVSRSRAGVRTAVGRAPASRARAPRPGSTTLSLQRGRSFWRSDDAEREWRDVVGRRRSSTSSGSTASGMQ